MFQVNNKNTRTMSEICSKLTIKILEEVLNNLAHCSGASVVVTLNKLPNGYWESWVLLPLISIDSSLTARY